MKDLFTHMPPQVRAEAGLVSVRSMAEKSISETIPQAKEYKDLWVKNIMPCQTLQKLSQAERAVRPTEPLLIHRALIEAGLPKVLVDSYHFQVSSRKPFFSDYEKGRLYVLESFLNKLTGGDPVSKTQAGIMLGFHLVEANIRSIAYRLSPMMEDDERNDYWRMIMRETVIGFAQNQKEDFRDKGAYEKFEDMVNDLFSERGLKREGGVIEAVGGAVLCRLPGQSRMSPEIRIGVNFDEGTVRSLTLGAKKRFVELFIKSDIDDLSGGVESLLGISGMQKEAEVVHQILDLQPDGVLESFSSSKLPRLYNESEDPRINPFQYPQIIEESNWLKI